MRTILIGTLALTVALSGCQSTGSSLATAAATVNADVAAAQATLAKISTSVASACKTIKVAEGYYAVAQPFIPTTAQAAETVAAGVVDSICAAASSTTLATVLPQLSQAWATIQAATTKPGT
jgi:hypothetical protein